jgi:DNA-binding Xre family transcriptional regulator
MSLVRLDLLARDLQRGRSGRSMREVAPEIGSSIATLSRVERGKSCDLETFARLCRWLDKSPARYFRTVD